MKIVFLAAGNSIHTIRWVNTLSEKGHDVSLIHLPNQAPSIDKLGEKVKVFSLKFEGNKGYYLNKLQVKKIIEAINPDVINAHYASGYGTLARISKVRPLVLSVWGSDVYEFPYRNFLCKKIAIKNILNADLVASTSTIMGKQVNKLIENEDLEVTTTPFGVDVSNFEKKIHNDSDDGLKIGIIKTLAPKYGIVNLIEAIFDIKKRGYNITLDIYGDGPQKEELVELINKLDLNSEVFLKGKIPNEDVPKVLLSFDIFSVASIYDSESFGVAVVEAMAAGLPVVASDVDGFLEVVDDNSTGFIFERNNIEDLSSKLIRLIENPQIRKDFGEKGRIRAEKMFDWNNNVEEMELLYKKLKK